MTGRGAVRLAPLLLAGTLSACIPPRPLSVTGMLPPQRTSYTLIDGDLLDPSIRAVLDRELMARGLLPATTASPPERFISISFADRPHTSGTFASDTPPSTRTASGWLDKPQKDGWFAIGRREARLSIRFLGSDGQVREERTGVEVIRRTAPDADMAQMLGRMLAR